MLVDAGTCVAQPWPNSNELSAWLHGGRASWADDEAGAPQGPHTQLGPQARGARWSAHYILDCSTQHVSEASGIIRALSSSRLPYAGFSCCMGMGAVQGPNALQIVFMQVAETCRSLPRVASTLPCRICDFRYLKDLSSIVYPAACYQSVLDVRV